MGFTCHSEGSPQPRRQLLGVVVSQLHAAHPDDLTHKADFLSLQILAAQVLRGRDGKVMKTQEICEESIAKLFRMM